MNSEASGDCPLIRVRGLEIELGRPRVRAVNGIDFSIQHGEIVALAGESGSGKSLTALALTRLLPEAAMPVLRGDIRLEGVDRNILTQGEKFMRKIRGSQIGYVFQEPSASFNPVYSIRAHLQEILRLKGVPRKQHAEEMARALEEVGIPADRAHLDAWPADFSGGMLQRAAIACALLGSPRLLIADEPTTALDTSTQKRIIDLFKRLNRERRMAILFISHDLGLLRDFASRLFIMREGNIVEAGLTDKVLGAPENPYTRGLLDALPRLRT